MMYIITDVTIAHTQKVSQSEAEGTFLYLYVKIYLLCSSCNLNMQAWQIVVDQTKIFIFKVKAEHIRLF